MGTNFAYFGLKKSIRGQDVGAPPCWAQPSWVGMHKFFVYQISNVGSRRICELCSCLLPLLLQLIASSTHDETTHNKSQPQPKPHTQRAIEPASSVRKTYIIRITWMIHACMHASLFRDKTAAAAAGAVRRQLLQYCSSCCRLYPLLLCGEAPVW